MTQGRLSHGRMALAIGFFVQGVVFALLVTRIPAIQDRYGISDALLPAFLAAVPVLAGGRECHGGAPGKRVRPAACCGGAQVAVGLALLGVGSRVAASPGSPSRWRPSGWPWARWTRR